MTPDRHLTRRAFLLGAAAAASAACDPRRLADSRRQAWCVLVDLSGTAATDREYYVRELRTFVKTLGNAKPSVPLHVVGFSSFAKPIVSGQAQLVASGFAEAARAVLQWPRDPKTDLGAAFQVAHDLVRRLSVDRRTWWILSDGVHDPGNRWRARPEHAVVLPRDLPLKAMAEADTSVHWDAIDEYQLAGWQRALDSAEIPAVLHLRGYVEAPTARLQRIRLASA